MALFHPLEARHEGVGSIIVGQEGAHRTVHIDIKARTTEAVVGMLREAIEYVAPPADLMDGGVSPAVIENEISEAPAIVADESTWNDKAELTAANFADAEFARHPDGRVAARAESPSRLETPWVDRNGWISDRGMAGEGWAPVRATQLDVDPLPILDELAKARGQIHELREQLDATAEESKARAESMHELEARHPRTAAEISDEMVERAWNRWIELDPRDAHSMRLALVAALTEPPARPEGAEQLDALVDMSIRGCSDITSPETVRHIADGLAEEGVRAPGVQS